MAFWPKLKLLPEFKIVARGFHRCAQAHSAFKHRTASDMISRHILLSLEVRSFVFRAQILHGDSGVIGCLLDQAVLGGRIAARDIPIVSGHRSFPSPDEYVMPKMCATETGNLSLVSSRRLLAGIISSDAAYFNRP